MNSKQSGVAQGYVREVPGGWVFEIGNEWLNRRIYCIGGKIGTTSLVHGLDGEEYLEETVEEFALTLSSGEDRVDLNFRDFVYTGHATPKWDDDERLLEIKLEADTNGGRLPISLFYQAERGKDYLRKWIEVHPVQSDWTLVRVTLENMRFKEQIEGVVPFSRYPMQFSTGEDNVHVTPERVAVEDREKRFSFGDTARALVTYWGFDEGLFFFVGSILGQESFHSPRGLLMRQIEHTPISEGFVSGPAVIGAYAGPPELGFKRYKEYLMEHWCVIEDKSIPVAWDTWLVTLENDKPVFSDYDRGFLLEYMELLRDAGYYDILHMDLGWESGKYLQPDPVKFPNGLSEIVRRAKECGIDMGYWINPFSAAYWKSEFEDEQPEWLTPDVVSVRSGAHPLCIMTPYYDYVEQRLIQLVAEFNARLIYWDGGDWNIPHCTAADHDHWDTHDLRVHGLQRLTQLCNKVRKIRPNIIISAFNLPFDNHRLNALDQEHVSDTHSSPTIKSELIQRQQMYQMTWEHPYHAIRGSWYGVNWHEAGERNLERPLRELIHAEMSMIGNGVNQAGSSFDLKQASPQFLNFMRKLFAWRKQFEKYFTVYQHILGFPDGESVDGEAHIIDGKGFIILINPSEEELSVPLPLSEPELELADTKTIDLYDWSDLEHARPMGKARISSAPEVELTPLEVKIIGINVSS